MSRVLILTRDVPAAQMAGPAVRAWEIAGELSRQHEVRLVSLTACTRESESFDAFHVPDGAIAPQVDWADVIVVQGDVLGRNPEIERSTAVVIIDLYDPYPLEQLEQTGGLSSLDRRVILRHAGSELARQLARGDHFMCASERQRDLWVGSLLAAGRINPVIHSADPSFRSLIAVVPFGLPSVPPKPQRSAIRERVAGIASSDPIVVWGGGIYNWFDPVTLVRAIDVVRQRVPNVRLWFMATQHPNPEIDAHATAREAEEVSRSLGLTDVHVFFNRDWVDYDSRVDVLCDADVAVSAHGDHLETRYAFRTRVLDYLWCGLPMVLSAGDAFGDLVEHESLGAAVPTGDVSALAEAITALLTDSALRESTAIRVRSVAERFRWEEVLTPLVSWCDAPSSSPDRVDDLWRRDIERRRDAVVEADGARGAIRALQERVDRDGIVGASAAVARRAHREITGRISRK